MTKNFIVVFVLAVLGIAPNSHSGQVTFNRYKKIKSDDLFIRWKPGVSKAARNRHYDEHSLRPVWRSRLVPGLERVKVMKMTEDRAALESTLAHLSGAPEIMYAQPNQKIRRALFPYQATRVRKSMLEELPNDPLFSKQWALRGKAGIHIEEAWKLAHGSDEIKVAVIDTGVDSKHEDLSGHVADGFDFIDQTNGVYDHHGHGSHVSGIIGARTNNGAGVAGINPNVTIVPLRAVPTDGDETDANVIEAFEYAVKVGARVANCSFGKAESSQAVGDVIAAAGQHGLLAVVAAGNSREDLNQDPSYPASFQTENMIVVAAIGSSGAIAGFSNYGVSKVDIAAPGVSILSSVLDNGYASWDGTSMAAPQVAGVAALVLSVNPKLTVRELKEIILRSAVVDPMLKSFVTTSGRVDALAAVTLAKSLQ